MSSASREVSANTANLRRLFWLRNIAIVGQIAAVSIVAGMAHLHSIGIEHIRLEALGMPVVIGMMQDQLPLNGVATIIVSLAIFNAAVWIRLNHGRDTTGGELFVHLLVDVAALTALLYLTGGATNPFALLLLLPVIIAATVLPGRFTWAIMAVTVGCYSLLLSEFVPLPHSHAIGHDFSLYVLGSWLGYLLVAALVAYFIVGMGNALRRQDRLLAQAREHAVKHDQLIALGTLAASTAHELGTPLGTMSLLVAELERDDAHSPTAPALREQLERCKQALSVLSASAGEVPMAGGRAMRVDRYLGELLHDWQSRRPGTRVHADWHGSEPPPMILAERTLSQALANILDNAADASPDNIACEAEWSEDELTVEVRDRGRGLSEEARENAGSAPFGDKAQGLGLGLFLSHGIIHRLGGRVSLHDQAKGGLRTHISLPLDALAVAS